MARGSAAEYLIRTVLDEEFRELASTDPRRAFEGYELSDEEQEILCARDARLLGLLGQAFAQAKTVVEPPAAEVRSDASEQQLTSLAAVKLLLRLAPQGKQEPDSTSAVAYAATLEPWPGDDQLQAAEATSAAEAGQAGQSPPPEVAWIIRIQPTVLESQAAGLKVAYSASILPLTGSTENASSPTPDAGPTSAASPWHHHTESAAAQAAAGAVRASDAEGRYEKLLDLIHALQTGDERG